MFKTEEKIKPVPFEEKINHIPLEGEIPIDSRAIYQTATRAMQGNIILALIELITNSDDSYDRMGEIDRRIFIYYQKKTYKGVFSVKDDAAGMDINDIERFLKYWKENELEDSDGQRGYFGKGAKDALACMNDGEIASFKDGKFIRVGIFFNEHKKMQYKIYEECKVTTSLRKKYSIVNNGTVASFVADPHKDKKIKVPQFSTLYGELSNHYLLRKILQNDNTIVTLIRKGSQKDRRRLAYVQPKGVQIHSDSFEVLCDGFDSPFKIDMTVSRSKTALTQKEAGDCRHGGLLVVDDKSVVLDISLFKYDHEVMASKFFGEVVFNGFRKLLKKNEIVLSPERNGLIRNHPTIISLVEQIEKRLDKLIQDEKIRLQRDDVSDEGRIFQKNMKKFCDVLNEISAEVLGDLEDEVEKIDDDYKPIHGFCFNPASKKVCVDCTSVFALRIDTSKVKPGTVVTLHSTNPTIRFKDKDDRFVVGKKKAGRSTVITKCVSVIGSKPDEVGTIIARVSDQASLNFRETNGSIYISPPADISEFGIAWQYTNTHPVPGRPKKVFIMADAKSVSDGDEIFIESDNKNIHISHKKVNISDMINTKRGICKFEIEVWGQGEGQDGILSATCNNGNWEMEAMMGVQIRNKKPSKDRCKSMSFSPAELRSDEDPPQSSSYSKEMKKVLIYTKFPTVEAFVGKNREFLNSIPAQQCISQLNIEKYCFNLAWEAIDNKGTILSESNKFDAIQGKANELIKKYGKRLIEASLDKTLLQKSLKNKK